MKQFIVITSINPPTEAVKKFASMKDYQLIVVGDKKTPTDWKCENVIYLSPDEQLKLGYRILKYLPFNSYSRKMVGYLYAIQQGAEIIIDSDDDNIPDDNWGYPEFQGNYLNSAENIGFLNIFKYYTHNNIWPRGFPLQYVLNSNHNVYTCKPSNVGVWCELVNGDTDVDAVYRLTNNSPIEFNKCGSVVLGKNTVCPFNSQNTVFRKELFPLLYMPAFATIRATDIYRGYIAQPLMWAYGYRMGFTQPTAVQIRNPHNYLKDFEHEIPCYLNSEKLVQVVKDAIMEKQSLCENLVNSYVALTEVGIMETKEVRLLNLWLQDLEEVIQ